MATKKILDLLNQAIARELQVSIQYMWQHVLWKGIEGFAVKDEQGAVTLYKRIVEECRNEGDHTTMRLFRQILADEEEHLDTFQGLLGK